MGSEDEKWLAWVSVQKSPLENACRLMSQLAAAWIERRDRQKAKFCRFYRGGGSPTKEMAGPRNQSTRHPGYGEAL